MRERSFDLNLPPREVYTVSELNRKVRLLLEDCFPEIWVEGEVSNVSKPASGHCYFSLKDEHSQIRCALFRGRRRLMDFDPEDGNHVLVRAQATLYETRGDFQLVIQHIEDAGEGRLRRAFDALKRKLEQEGLFDVQHKQNLPWLPRRVGIITSPSGAAIRDIVSTFLRRFPAIPLLVYPVAVQGRGAAGEIVDALRLAAKHGECDVLILARGGGSLEDLWSFNEESVARAIFDCPIPVVTGIGHEIDFTIADFVADRRAATPTAAAEVVSPEASELIERITALYQHLDRRMSHYLERASQHVDWLTKRITHPRQRLAQARQRSLSLCDALHRVTREKLLRRLASLGEIQGRIMRRNPVARMQILEQEVENFGFRMAHAINARIARDQHRLSAAAGRLHGMSPLATLQRGYALVVGPRDDRLITDARQVKRDDRVRVRLARGQLACIIEEITEA